MSIVTRTLTICLLASLPACESRTSPLPWIPKPTAPTDTEFAGYTPATAVTVPPFRRTIAGTVHQVRGGPIAGVVVTGPLTQDGVQPRAVTAADGSFRIEQTLTEQLWFERPGYHAAYWILPREAYLQDIQSIAVRMQPKIFLASGSRLSGTLWPDDTSFAGGYPFGDEGASYECSPCELIDVSGADNGARLRLSWPGPVPLAMWAGNIQSWDGPYITAVGRSGESELVRSTTSRINAVLVGLETRTGLKLTEPVSFVLEIEKQ